MAEIANTANREPWPSLGWATWLFDRSSWLLVASLVVGLLSTVTIVWMGTVKEHHWDLLRDKSQETIAGLNNETARLSAEAEASRAAIAGANERAAEANKIAAEANKAAAEANERAAKAALDLEKFKAPRSVSKISAAHIVEQIKAFSGTQFAIAIPGQVHEIEHFAEQIEVVLKMADWEPVEWKGAGDIKLSRPDKVSWGLASANGIVLELYEGQKDRLLPIARALASIVKSEGFAISVRIAKVSPPETEQVLKIIVGDKK